MSAKVKQNVNDAEPEKRRNLFLRISQYKKDQLRELAKRSGMTMETYAAAVLEDAIESGDLFRYVKVRNERTPPLSN